MDCSCKKKFCFAFSVSVQPWATLWRELGEWGFIYHLSWFYLSMPCLSFLLCRTCVCFPQPDKCDKQPANKSSTFSNLFSIPNSQWINCRVVDDVYRVKSRSYSHLTTFWSTREIKIIWKVFGNSWEPYGALCWEKPTNTGSHPFEGNHPFNWRWMFAITITGFNYYLTYSKYILLHKGDSLKMIAVLNVLIE